MMISNYNFAPLEVWYGKRVISQIAPKETSFVNSIDIKAQQPNLDWKIFDADLQDYLILQTPNLDIYKRLSKGEPSIE